MKREDLFKEATKMMFPDLQEDDPRFAKVVKYINRDYNLNNKHLCVLCAISGSEIAAFGLFDMFCKANALDPGRREVIISDWHILYSPNWKARPEVVI